MMKKPEEQKIPISNGVMSVIIAVAWLLISAAPGLAVESGDIISASPSSFTGGVATTVTVRVHNTGSSDDMIIEWDSKPSGWSISPSYRNPYMTSGSYYNATFTVTPPLSGGSGTIVWKFYDDDVWSNDLLDTYYQSVTASAVKPDLIVQDISVSSPRVAGQSATITATLKNQGDADADGSIRLNYYVDNGYIGYDNLSLGLNAGSSNNESISYTVNSSGNHDIKVTIDTSADAGSCNIWHWGFRYDRITWTICYCNLYCNQSRQCVHWRKQSVGNHVVYK